MDEPDDFETWSEACKQSWRALAAEDAARVAAEDELTAAETAERDAGRAKTDLEALQVTEETEHAVIKLWLKGYYARRTALKKTLSKELNDEYQTWDNPNRTNEERRAKYRELKQRHDDALAALETEKTTKEARESTLRTSIRARKELIEDACDALTEAEARVRRAQEALEKMRSFDQIEADMLALIKRCGPKDPKPGDPAIPINPRAISPHKVATPNDQRSWFVDPNRFERYMVGVDWPVHYIQTSADVHYLSGEALKKQKLELLEKEKLPIEEIANGKVWHEGCVEYLWLQGTSADYQNKSNPITRTIERVAQNVNDIWAPCCVHFKAYLKVVTLDDLGPLKNAANGFSTVNGKTHSVSLDDIADAYRAKLKSLADNKECTAFLVVDEVVGGAGYATFGDKVGVITVSHNGNQSAGGTTAHELGHAVASIDHVEGEGANQVKHEHGELMWGKGCVDYPNKRRIKYEKVTDADCTAMRAKTTATKDPCKKEPM